MLVYALVELETPTMIYATRCDRYIRMQRRKVHHGRQVVRLGGEIMEWKDGNPSHPSYSTGIGAVEEKQSNGLR